VNILGSNCPFPGALTRATLILQLCSFRSPPIITLLIPIIFLTRYYSTLAAISKANSIFIAVNAKFRALIYLFTLINPQKFVTTPAIINHIILYYFQILLYIHLLSTLDNPATILITRSIAILSCSHYLFFQLSFHFALHIL